MKKLYFLAALLLTLSTQAQFNYPPALGQNLAGNYVDLGASGSVISTANFDDANSAAIPIGFGFSFNGSTRTHFILNTNGFIKLGSNASMSPPSAAALFYTAGNNYLGGIFNSTNTADVNLISAFNHDLEAAAAGAEYRTTTTGASGSRVCTIQFKNLKDKTTTPAVQYDSINFQIKLYETTNIIEIQFGPYYSSSNPSAFKSSACGLKGSNTTDITAVTKGSTTGWSTATFISGNYPGNAFNFGNDVNPGARPMPDPGRTLRFTPAFANDLSVSTIYSMGILPIPYALPHTIGAPIVNLGTSVATNKKVYLEITGANPYRDTANIATLATSSTFTRNFNGFKPDKLGINNIKIYVDADDNPANDTAYLRQEVTKNIFSYADTSRPLVSGGLGYNTGSGLILNKYKVNGSRYVTGAEIFLMADVAGNSMYAVVMNTAGTIVAQSQTFFPTLADTMRYHYFDFPQPPLFKNADFYVGLAQLANPSFGYFPQGTVPESPMRTGAYFSTGIAGSATPTDIQTLNLSIDPQPLIKGYVAGNDIRVKGFSGVPEITCPVNNATINVEVINYDSTLIDFSQDTLTITVSTNNPITQSFSTKIGTGSLAPGDSLSVPVSSNFDFSTQGNYTLRVRADIDLEVDSNDNKRNYNIEVIPPVPSVTINVWPATSVCYGDSISFTAVPKSGGNNTYQWKLDNVNFGTPTTDSILIPTNLLSSKVTVEMTTQDCNSNPATVTSNEIDLVVNPSPIALAGKDTVIENTKTLYFFSPRPNSTIVWNVTNGVPDNINGNSVNITWGSAGTGKIEITETNQNNCSYVTVKEIPVVSIVGLDALNAKGFEIGEIFPNPGSDIVNLELYSPQNAQVSVRLYDIAAKLISSIYEGDINGKKKIRWDVSKMDAGMYYFEIIMDGHRAIRKLSVNH